MKELVQKAKNGDREAFGLIYREYFSPIYRFIYFKVGNREEAEDLTQETFIKALNSLKQLEDRGGGFAAWMFRIARNTVIDYFRQKKSLSLDELSSGGLHFTDGLPSLEESAAKSEEIASVFKVLEEIDEETREIVILKYVEGLSYKEISLVVGKTEEAARQASSRGLKKVKEKLDKDKKLWEKT